MALIQTSFNENIGTITFNNYEKRNSLSKDFINEIIEALDNLINKKARAVILRAPKGVKVWSAGHDVKELSGPGRDPLSYNDPLEQLLRAVERFPAPVIAMIEGGVWGGACELALTSDIIIAAHSATFAITPARLGVPYNSAGILHFLNILPINIVKEMFFTAQPIDAERALRIGILNHLVPAEELESFTFDMAKKIAANSALSISVIKEQLRLLSKAHPLSPETFERIQGLRRLVYDSNDYKEGIKAFMEKRIPVYKDGISRDDISFVVRHFSL